MSRPLCPCRGTKPDRIGSAASSRTVGGGELDVVVDKPFTLTTQQADDLIEMVGNLMKMMAQLSPGEQKSWLQIYSKIYDYCQKK